MQTKRRRPAGIQVLISISFSAVAMTCLCFLGIFLYRQFVHRYEEMTRENSKQLLEQAVVSLEDYLRSMRRISDAMYYTVLKGADLAKDNVVEQMDLLYEANKDNLVSIACYYAGSGILTDACPLSTAKTHVDVSRQDWFVEARREPENFHFSTPHVQNLFEDPSLRHYWVISLSRAVELTRNGVSNQGILLVDMNYASIVQLLDKANADLTGGYVYLMDREGNLIYHPRLNQIRSGLKQEDTGSILSREEESFYDVGEEGRRIVTVKTVSYTGWKLVRVVPMSTFSTNMLSTRYLVMLLVALALLAVILVNQFVSHRITMPLRRLNDSVARWEAGGPETEIYVGGSAEVEHLGMTLRDALRQSSQLMEDVLVEQEAKRKSELDALQSQINPHFLYNTLDSIVWMVTAGKQQEAVYMIKQLASLFRISLSKGRTIITIDEELQHARHYVNIQKIRYRNDFTVTFAVAPEITGCATVKLILQPLLENAIYYGMEYMDDEGEITVTGRRDASDIVLEVADNGPGMPEEQAARLLTGDEQAPSSGSGVGLKNVHNRIRLRFGERYGLTIESHPDEGMKVQIRLPYVEATKENLKRLEAGKPPVERDQAAETPAALPREGGGR